MQHLSTFFGNGMKRITICSLLFLLIFFSGEIVKAEDETKSSGSSDPFNMTFSIDSGEESGRLTTVLKIAIFLTFMSILPGLVMSMTSFLRIIIVLSFVKQAIGTPQMPPNQVVIGIAIFLTMFIMSPVWKDVNSNAIQPYMKKEINEKEAFENGLAPMREFMLRQTREADLGMFISLSGGEKPGNVNEISTFVLIPAFITSELKTAFQMGFILYLPFIVIDAVISTTLTAMGMFMLPPVMISLPFKLILFVLADGWRLIIQSVVSSFR